MPLTSEQIEKSESEAREFFAKEYPSTNDKACASNEIANVSLIFFVVGWLARQETLCVELPQKLIEFEDADIAHNYCRGMCAKSIEAAGIAHK